MARIVDYCTAGVALHGKEIFDAPDARPANAHGATS